MESNQKSVNEATIKTKLGGKDLEFVAMLLTETNTMMTPDELTAFKEKWRIMWHPEMTEDEILDLVDQEGHTSGEPEVQTEATPKTQLPQAREESRKEAKPDKKKKVFWCCC